MYYNRWGAGTLSAHGFTDIKYSGYTRKPAEYSGELLLRNVPYTMLYEGRGFTEFLLKSQKYDLEIRIECKWQQAAGSVDKKLPHVYSSTIETVPGNEVIILING